MFKQMTTLTTTATFLMAATPALADSIDAKALEDRVDAFMATLDQDLGAVPGFSVAIVGPNGLKITKGYGLASAESGQKADANTQFYIASSTKSLTGMAIASLVAKGKLDLDAPISRYLPDAPAFAEDITLKDLLTHTSGRDSDAITWRTAFTGEHDFETLKAIFYNSTASENGRDFTYDNMGYNVAGLVLEAVFVKPWQQIVAEEVLIPLGMDSTTAYASRLNLDNFAAPHAWFGRVHAMPMMKTDSTMHAAGGHFTTANDMAIWLEALLNGGKAKSGQLQNGATDLAVTKYADVDANFFQFHRTGYGLGWYQSDYKGLDLWHHFGSYTGYRSHVSFSPELGVGVAVFANELSPAGFNQPDMVAALVYDIARGVENPEGQLQPMIDGIASRMDQMRGRELPTRPRNAPADESVYVGDFYNADFGTFSFFLKDDELWAKFGNLETATTYREDGSVRVELLPYEGTLVFFDKDDSGQVTGLTYRGAAYAKR